MAGVWRGAVAPQDPPPDQFRQCWERSLTAHLRTGRDLALGCLHAFVCTRRPHRYVVQAIVQIDEHGPDVCHGRRYLRSAVPCCRCSKLRRTSFCLQVFCSCSPRGLVYQPDGSVVGTLYSSACDVVDLVQRDTTGSGERKAADPWCKRMRHRQLCSMEAAPCEC